MLIIQKVFGRAHREAKGDKLDIGKIEWRHRCFLEHGNDGNYFKNHDFVTLSNFVSLMTKT